jgi:hypothetical protein
LQMGLDEFPRGKLAILQEPHHGGQCESMGH